MRQVRTNEELAKMDLPRLKTVAEHLFVRDRPRPRSAGRARSRTHRTASLPYDSADPLPCLWQVEDNAELANMDLPALENVGGTLRVRARPRPRSSDRALSRAHRADEPSLLLRWRVMAACGGRSGTTQCLPN